MCIIQRFQPGRTGWRYGARTMQNRVAFGVLRATAGAAMMAVALAGGGTAAGAAQKAGIAAAVIGDVEVTPEAGGQARTAASGMDMYLGDHVVSDPGSRMQMLLLDQTVFSIGPNSDLVIDEFVYDPDTGNGKVAATFTKGLVRYVSGNVAKSQPENVRIKLPVGTMGIRGTIVMLADYEHAKDAIAGMQADDVAAVLLGPGPNNNTNAKKGGFEVVTDQGSTSVERSGYGVLLRPNQAPGAAFRIPSGLMALLQTQLTAASQGRPGGRGANNGVGDANSTSGQSAAQGAKNADDQAALGQQTAALNDEANSASELLNRTPESGPKPPASIPEPVPEPLNSIINGALNQGVGKLPFGVTLPYAVQASWDRSIAAGTFFDLDLHLTGPNAGGAGRFHVYYDNTGSFFSAPYAQLDADGFGTTASEVIGIMQLNSGGDYRASVYNFGNPSQTGTTLSDANTNLVVSLIKNGTISRGPNGSAVISLPSDIVTQVSPVSGQVGNTFQAFTFDSSGTPTTVQATINAASPADVQ